ncbi:hypothetical protein [Flavobacterium weaverense]|nr:hypothetical protein [Flavobacterium weaverense]
MKNIIYLIFSILLLSCSSSKIEKQVLNDFMNEQFIENFSFRVVIKQPISRILPLEFYEKAYDDRNIRLGDMIRIRPESNPPFVWPVDTIEIKNLIEKYKNDSTNKLWIKRDFHRPKFELTDSKTMQANRSSLLEKYFGDNALEISKPIVTTNKKYAFLFFRIFNVGIYFGHTTYSVILMENKNNKWKTIETYSEFNIIN